MSTTPIKRILCPVDLSETSGRALAYARMLAGWYDASVTAMQVIWLGIPPVAMSGVPAFITDAQQDEFSQDLKRFVEDARTTSAVDTVVVHGPIVQQILHQAKTGHADLIVMGTHGRTGLAHLLVGSVAEKVVRHSPIPVLTIRGPANAEPTADTTLSDESSG